MLCKTEQRDQRMPNPKQYIYTKHHPKHSHPTHPPHTHRLKDALLLLRRQRRVQRQHLDRPHLVPQPLRLRRDLPARVLDLLLPREEQQHVALRLAQVYLHHRADGGLQVVALGFLGVEDLDGVEAPRNLHQGGVQEVALGVFFLGGGGVSGWVTGGEKDG